MATELDVATAPAVTFTQEDLERIRQYEKIIKLSETITSGKHPRFKVPASLVSSNRATPDSSHPATTTNGVSAAKANALAHGANSHISHTSHASHTVKTATLPGLGLPAVGLSGFAAQRARIEAELQAQMKTAGKSQPESSDFLVDQVLQQARQLEKQFTPPPFAMSDLTAAGKQAPTDSGDDDTYYSSKFNTPEFGLAARIPAESDHGDVSMRDESSDYEPELDTVPSPKIQPPSQPQHPGQPVSLPVSTQQDAAQLAEAFPNMTTEATQQILASLIALQAQNATQAVPIPPPSFRNNGQLPWQGSAAVSASVPPQVVRTHDLSPVAPQPEHISALAVGSRLPEGQRGTILGPATQASLHQGEVSQSSPDSSPQVGGRFSDRRKEKKKRAGGKRKADTAPSSPAIKSEPRSPSPIAAPLAPPPKRQRHEQRAATGTAPRSGPAPARGTQYRREEQYNPAAQRTHVESRPQYATTRVVRESRPPVVYERIEPGRYEHPQEVIVSHPPHRGYETYETYETYEQAPAIYAPQHAPPRPASTAYGQPLPRTTISAGYPAQAPRAIPSGRASVRPEAFERGHHGSPDMAPPVARVQRVSPAHTTGRILVDEYNREYYEPVRPAPGPGPEPRPANVIETVPYDPNVAYERPASRQLYATTAPRYARMGSQMPAVYGDEEVVYQRTSPSFAPPARRVVTQPEYVTREYVDYAPPPREYSRPVQYATGHPGEHAGAPLEDAPPPPPREYLVRAATARLPEAPRYEVPVPVQSRYVERVGSVRPVENGMGPGRMRGGLQYAPEGVYVEGHRGGEYGMRPAQGPGPMPGLGPASQALVPDNTLYYPDQPSLQMARPPQEYVYEDGTHEVYR